MSERYLNPAQIFAEFAGRPVQLKTEPYKDPDNSSVTRTRFVLEDEQDPVVAAMEQKAKDYGLSLRLSWPTHEPDRTEHRDDRVTATISHKGDYKWVVTPRFYLG
jgi:hypothetical protein